MILAIDGYEANVVSRVGIGRYAYEILKHMYDILAAGNGKGHQVRVYLPSKPLADMPKSTSWWQYRVARPAKLWTFIGLPWALMTDATRPDVVFSPTHYIPRFIHLPRVMSIMDLSYLNYPEMFRSKDLYQLTQWTAYGVRRAARILTISQFSKNAIIKAYGVASKQVVVTYPGFMMKKPQSASQKHDVGKQYILAVGTLQPRKNYVRLIEAFSQAAPSLQKQYPDISLVIVGKKGWLYEEIFEAPKQYGVEARVKFLDFVPDEDLPPLYAGALCFALPSLYEGFGLPVLEAMAHRSPVVVSNVSSLPEIAGDAGVYVEPEDVASIARGLVTAISQRDSKEGKTRIDEGVKQMKKFTWEKAAQDTLNVLEQVAGGTI